MKTLGLPLLADRAAIHKRAHRPEVPDPEAQEGSEDYQREQESFHR